VRQQYTYFYTSQGQYTFGFNRNKMDM